MSVLYLQRARRPDVTKHGGVGGVVVLDGGLVVGGDGGGGQTHVEAGKAGLDGGGELVRVGPVIGEVGEVIAGGGEGTGTWKKIRGRLYTVLQDSWHQN